MRRKKRKGGEKTPLLSVSLLIKNVLGDYCGAVESGESFSGSKEL